MRGVLAFLDEEDELAVPQEPGRPRREPSGPERRRQQYLLRRLIGAGAGIAFLILLVIGFRGCLEARSDRGLKNYTQDVSTIMQESQQRGEEFFDAIQDSQLTEQGLEEKISSIRGACASLLDRAENVSVPGQMRDAQSATTLSLRLRRDAMEQISASVGQATADAETADALDTIGTQMGALYASDILWSQLGSPEITQVLESDQVQAPELPAGNFMPANDAVKFLDEAEIVSIFSGVGGTTPTGALRGLELVQTSIGDTVLSPDAPTTVADDAREISVQVTNGGETEETNVPVTVSIDGNEIVREIASIAPGATEEANLQLQTLPQPGSEVTVDVLVEPVPEEQLTDNNEASYTVVFGTA
jgi:hypothetical protein